MLKIASRLLKIVLLVEFLYDKIISLQHTDNSLNGIWGNPAGFKLYEIEDKCSRITMDREEDIQRVFKGNPCIVRNI